MGDRGNIVVSDGERGAVVLYTHWDGSRIEHYARTALAKRERWDDAPYLTRMIFSEMTKGAEHLTTGYGISVWPHLPDNQHPVLVIDVPGQQVGYTTEGGSLTALYDGLPIAAFVRAGLVAS